MPSAVATPASLAKRALRTKLLDVALQSKEFRSALDSAAKEIREEARQTATEATIEGCFERVVYALMRDIGLTFHPQKEVLIQTRRHLALGRMDSRLGALVIEYKRPSLLKTEAQIVEAREQLESYMSALSLSTDGAIAGLLTNGLLMVEVRALEGQIVHRSPQQKVDGTALLRLTELFISLALTALTSENLIRDFCGSQSDGVLFRTARTLYGILATKPHGKTTMLQSEWEEMFRLAHDDQSQQRRIEERRVALGSLFEISIDDSIPEYRALFALHTAYAILLKLIAYRVVSDIYLQTVNQDFSSLANSSATALRAFCSELEDGDIFRRLGIVNLLEGDFFSWYCNKGQWNSELARSVGEMVSILARYEEAKKIFDTAEVPDLFRDLYQAAVPRVVRSSFGEFYTPFWLAEHVLATAIQEDDWRAIDPCCGSGTFVIAAIAKLRNQFGDTNDGELLSLILSRVAALDLNPLSVLTTRIHYFIHISDLISSATLGLVIPVYLGDAARIPERLLIDGVECLRCELKTLRTPIDATLPVSLVTDTAAFVVLMQTYEQNIKSGDCSAAIDLLWRGVPPQDQEAGVLAAIVQLTNDLILLEANGWNGIWARILSNFLTTACLGKFSAIVGNPPWIDWKNLPAGYRERIKMMCVDRGLFSGAGRTGGINLNICALIAFVAMTNWLDKNGRLSFLMPKELANQASYEGWLRLGGIWSILELHDWSDVGHPFDPVKEDFITFVLGTGGPAVVPVTRYTRIKDNTKAAGWPNLEAAKTHFSGVAGVAGQVIPGSSAYTFAQHETELAEFSLVAGECAYKGREGIEFYPQELQLFTFDDFGPRAGTVWLRNVQVAKSKYKLPNKRVLLETKYLYPLVKGPAITAFRHNYDGLIVAFPYEPASPHKPIASGLLANESPLLLAYFNQHRDTIDKQTKFSDKIRGEDRGEFYGLARTGPYSFADLYVAFRDNTNWAAVVVSSVDMPWKDHKRFVFQNHSVSICERKDVGGLIVDAEAHYICAILNSPIVVRFINATSDQRSFKIQPPVYVPQFDPTNKAHLELVAASRKAHADPEKIEAARAKAEEVYLSLCRLRPSRPS